MMKPFTAIAVVMLAGCFGSASPNGARGDGDVRCPPGASTGGLRGCMCRPDLRLVLGACVSPQVAAHHCGVSATVAPEGCVLRAACEAGQARDLVSGGCMSRRDVRGLATSVGILVTEDDLVGCPAGGDLVARAGLDVRGVASSRLGCVPPAVRTSGVCPAGSLLDADNKCHRVFDRAQTDVAGWLRAAVGPDGGKGAPPLCDAMARAPGVLEPTSTAARLEVALLFPDNDVSLVTAQVRALSAAGAVDPTATSELDRAIAPMIEALRGLGGTASQASLTTTVGCQRPRVERPAALIPAPESPP